jgi:hypothetical protein
MDGQIISNKISFIGLSDIFFVQDNWLRGFFSECYKPLIVSDDEIINKQNKIYKDVTECVTDLD